MPGARMALVTGAAGFVGGRLVHALRDRGWKVRALEHDAASEGADERVRGDLRDPALRTRAVEGVSSVFHCAAWIEGRDAELADALNRGATIALAEAARDAGVRSFVLVSTQAVIGRGEGALDETAACAPTTTYGRTKLAAERALLAMRAGSMRVVILRPPLVYGPGERRSFARLARAVATGLFPIVGRGDNRVSFCHVENLTAALMFVAEDERARGVLHVADARPVTMREALDTIARATGAPRVALHVPERAARLVAGAAERAFARLGRRAPLDHARLDVLTHDRPLDTSALASLGFVPPVEFEEGVRETIDRYRDEGVL